jgi:hypothetical protein
MSVTQLTPSGRWVRDITMPANQGHCNSCWAIATCQAMSDRMRLKGIIPLNDELNYYTFFDYMHQTDPSLGSCSEGAYDDTGRLESMNVGAPLMSVAPDSMFGVDEAYGDEYLPHYKALGWTHLYTTSDIRNQLDYNGSVTVIINLYDSWYNHMGIGPYIPGPNEKPCGELHMVSLVGYDDRDNTFIVRNSYGRNWGWQGFVKIKQNDQKLNVLYSAYAPIV